MIETRAVGPTELDDLGRLFAQRRTTRHCWCTSFCATRTEFATGWFGGGNRRRFAGLAASETQPMGVLASTGGEPIGWCACGPRDRYLAAIGRDTILRSRVESEDHHIWLLPCFVIGETHRGTGVSHHLVRKAVQLARDAGATALDGWPVSSSSRRPGDAYLGREQVFADLGFTCIDRPTADRAIMRLQL